jgi:hypothetical protein
MEAGISPQDSAPEPAPGGDAAPHEITLAVWGMPDAVAAGECFAIKAGAKSSAGCALSGGRIEIHDAAGAVVASGSLGEAPWPGTDGLFWTEVKMQAPAAPGPLPLSAHFDAAEIEPPHASASAPFSVAIVERPEHMLTVKVTEKTTAAPIEDVQIRLGPHRAVTGASGLAEIRMPQGRFPLHIWKAGYEAPALTVDIDGDAAVQVEVAAIPEEDPDARWKG